LISFVALGAAFAHGSIALFVLFLILLGAGAAVMLKCKATEDAHD
jgi:hypothetical protein